MRQVKIVLKFAASDGLKKVLQEESNVRMWRFVKCVYVHVPYYLMLLMFV